MYAVILEKLIDKLEERYGIEDNTLISSEPLTIVDFRDILREMLEEEKNDEKYGIRSDSNLDNYEMAPPGLS